jgi:SAM-dependent methyltransferase
MTAPLRHALERLRPAAAMLPGPLRRRLGRLLRPLLSAPPAAPTGEPPAASAAEPLPVPSREEAWLDEIAANSDDAYFHTYLGSHRKRLAQSLALIPPAAPGGALLELACWGQLVPVFRHRLGYAEVVGAYYRTAPEIPPMVRDAEGNGFIHIDVEADTFPLPDDTFDIVLCWELIEHLAYDPMHMLAEVNRVTRIGGSLFITTPNIASARSLRAALHGAQPMLYPVYNRKRLLDRHHIEYAPGDLRRLIEAAGFEVVSLTSSDFYSDGHQAVLDILRSNGFSTDLRGDTLLLVARKAGPVRDRHPAGIYES